MFRGCSPCNKNNVKVSFKQDITSPDWTTHHAQLLHFITKCPTRVQQTRYVHDVFSFIKCNKRHNTSNAEYCSFTSAQAKKLQRITTVGDVNETYGGVAEGSRRGAAVVKGRTHVVTAGNHFPSWGQDWSRV